jgi:hypothetical protein
MFDDGSVEQTDIIVGMRSAMGKAVLADMTTSKNDSLVRNSTDINLHMTPFQTIIPMSCLSPGLRIGLQTCPVTMTFGPDGFFGHAFCTKSFTEPSSSSDEEDHDKFIMWWCNYESYPAPNRKHFPNRYPRSNNQLPRVPETPLRYYQSQCISLPRVRMQTTRKRSI